jgi:pyrroline-5-carboxylate reductase
MDSHSDGFPNRFPIHLDRVQVHPYNAPKLTEGIEMLADKRIAFIGSGVMAEAMIKGLLRKEVTSAKQIVASGPREDRGTSLQDKYLIAVTTDNKAVKPQMLNSVLDELRGEVSEDALVISIIAGARIERIEKRLVHKGVVRSMPNTPAQIGEGITVWTDSEAVTEEQQTQARTVLNALGEEVYLDEEDYLDMATALSGTGPSYVFLFMEAMVDAGVHLGFPRYVAEKLVLQTVRGSAEYIRQAPEHLARMRNQVTSPGGTSAEALYFLERAGFRTAISRAIWAAYQRSVALGEGKQKDRLPGAE